MLGTVVVFTFGTIVFGMVALATGRQRFWNTIMVLAIAITIPLDLIFVPWADRTYGNGAIGGAMAYVVTEALMFALGLWKVAPYLVERTFIWRLARVLIAGGLMFMASWPLRDEPLMIPIAVGAVVYVALRSVVLRVPEKDDLLRLREHGLEKPQSGDLIVTAAWMLARRRRCSQELRRAAPRRSLRCGRPRRS